MNQEMLRIEKQVEELLATLRQLTGTHTFSAIDRDLLKHQCLLVYEQLSSLTPEEQPVQPPVKKEPEPPVTVVETIIPVEEVPAPPPVIQKPLFEESMTLNDLAAKSVETPVVKAPPTETEILNTTIDTILELKQEKIEKSAPDPELTLHEKIAAIEPRENLIEKLSASIPSLKNAINVNLKIALVNHLFNENTVEYVKSIDKLNTCENIHEAMRYFNELKHQYGWDSENHNVKELEQLLNKRYNS